MVSQFGTNTQSEIPISIAVSQNGTKVAEKQVIIHFDGLTAFGHMLFDTTGNDNIFFKIFSSLSKDFHTS